MKILYVSKYLEAEMRKHGDEGGTGYQLVGAIQDLGHEVIAFTHDPKAGEQEIRHFGKLKAIVNPESKRSPLCSIPDKFLKQVYGYRQLLTDALRIKNAIGQHGPFDLILTASEEPDGLICAFAKRHIGVKTPVVVQVQALRYDIDASGAIHFNQHRPLGLSFKEADRVIANSPMVQDLVVSKYQGDQSKIGWLPHNLTSQFLDKLNGTSMTSRKPENPTILFFGGINLKKGADLFLEAAKVISQRGREARFRLVGNLTEQESDFAKRWPSLIKESGLGSRLELVNHLPSKEIFQEIQKATAVVLPSRIDEFSRAAIECLALGTPVVITEMMGASYLPKRDGSGLVVPANELEPLVKAMEEILKSGIYSEAAQRSQAKIREEFAPQTLARKWVEIFEQIRK